LGLQRPCCMRIMRRSAPRGAIWCSMALLPFLWLFQCGASSMFLLRRFLAEPFPDCHPNYPQGRCCFCVLCEYNEYEVRRFVFNHSKGRFSLFTFTLANFMKKKVTLASIIFLVLPLVASAQVTIGSLLQLVGRTLNSLVPLAIGLAVVVFAILLISLVATLVRTGRL